jgi:hypothetical protein
LPLCGTFVIILASVAGGEHGQNHEATSQDFTQEEAPQAAQTATHDKAGARDLGGESRATPAACAARVHPGDRESAED